MTENPLVRSALLMYRGKETAYNHCMKKFNLYRADLKKHFNNVKELVTQMIRHGEAGTLLNRFCDGIQCFEEKTGLVLYAVPGRFSLQSQEGEKTSAKHLVTRTRCVFAQSPGPGAFAFKIKSGRGLVFTVVCTQMTSLGLESYRCEVTSVTRDGEELGSARFEVSQTMLQAA